MRLALILCILAGPVLAWNGTGHRVIAAIAYDSLNPPTRARVDDLIRRHPDYQTFLRGTPRDSALRARAAFIAASVWADQIRTDRRFTNGTRHADWHYINIGFTQDGTPVPKAPEPNAVTEILRLSRSIDPEGLVWLIHLVGDLHNPLHAATRVSREYPKGDRGGNDVYVQPRRNLHAFWDGLPGPDPSSAEVVDRMAASLMRQRSTEIGSEDPAKWAAEGVEAAKTLVYSFGPSSGTLNRPIRLSRNYQDSAKSLSMNQLALAGRRLAGLLNRHLP